MRKAIALLTLAVIFFRFFALAGGLETIDSLLPAGDGEPPEDRSMAAVAGENVPLVFSGSGGPEEDEPEREVRPTPPPTPKPELVYNEEEQPEILPTTINGGLTISNATGYEPDVAALLEEGLNIVLPAEGPQILIIHTHGCEAYAQDRYDLYEESDSTRTLDAEHSVIRVGTELAERLESYGLSVIHDIGIYDHPSYTGSYLRSQAAVESYLAEYPDIGIVIDLHRDALGTGDVVYKTVADVSGAQSSQIMLLVGTGEKGNLYHPYWQENLKLALFLQQAVGDRYSSLMRPIALKQERYNMHLTTGSLILEVGSSGNTLQEALTAIRLFADSAGPMLLGLVEKNADPA